MADGPTDVLIVDDSQDTCRALRALLRMAGHAAECCPDGRAALDYLAGRRPGLLLLDVMMPGLSGLDVLDRLRHDPRWSHVAGLPIVLYTAVADPHVEREGRRLGAADVVLKAGGWDALYPRLTPYLDAARAAAPVTPGA